MKLQLFYKPVFQFTMIQKKLNFRKCYKSLSVSMLCVCVCVCMFFQRGVKGDGGIGRTLNFSLLAAMYMSYRPMWACFVSYAIKSEHTNRVCIVDVCTCECMCVNF